MNCLNCHEDYDRRDNSMGWEDSMCPHCNFMDFGESQEEFDQRIGNTLTEENRDG